MPHSQKAEWICESKDMGDVVLNSEIMDDQALFLKSTLISTPLGTTMEVTSLSWAEVHSRSIYLLKMVISQLSQVLEP